nr:hypothetical protein [Novipirellula galeiformis]
MTIFPLNWGAVFGLRLILVLMLLSFGPNHMVWLTRHCEPPVLIGIRTLLCLNIPDLQRKCSVCFIPRPILRSGVDESGSVTIVQHGFHAKSRLSSLGSISFGHVDRFGRVPSGASPRSPSLFGNGRSHW